MHNRNSGKYHLKESRSAMDKISEIIKIRRELYPYVGDELISYFFVDQLMSLDHEGLDKFLSHYKGLLKK